MSRILSTGGCTPPWADTPLADTLLVRHSLGRHPPLGKHRPGQTLPSPADGHCSGQYTSYWNAFLLIILLTCTPIHTYETAGLPSQFSKVAPLIKDKSRLCIHNRNMLAYPNALFTRNVFLKTARFSLALCL